MKITLDAKQLINVLNAVNKQVKRYKQKEFYIMFGSDNSNMYFMVNTDVYERRLNIKSDRSLIIYQLAGRINNRVQELKEMDKNMVFTIKSELLKDWKNVLQKNSGRMIIDGLTLEQFDNTLSCDFGYFGVYNIQINDINEINSRNFYKHLELKNIINRQYKPLKSHPVLTLNDLEEYASKFEAYQKVLNIYNESAKSCNNKFDLETVNTKGILTYCQAVENNNEYGEKFMKIVLHDTISGNDSINMYYTI